MHEGCVSHKGLAVNAIISQYVSLLVLLHKGGFLQGRCSNNFNKPHDDSLSTS